MSSERIKHSALVYILWYTYSGLPRRSQSASFSCLLCYGEFDAVIEISSGRILAGQLPSRVKRLVEQWRRKRKAALVSAWKAAIAGEMPQRIAPLE